MTHRLLVSYGQPTDTAAFDTYYADTHTPLALTVPGLVPLTVGRPQPMAPGQPAPYLVAELDFESEQAMAAAFETPEGRATGADVANFATGGATMAHFEVQEFPTR